MHDRHGRQSTSFDLMGETAAERLIPDWVRAAVGRMRQRNLRRISRWDTNARDARWRYRTAQRASPHCSHVRTQAGLQKWRAGVNDPGVAQHEDGCFMDSRGLRGAQLRGHCVMLRMSIASVASAWHVRGVCRRGVVHGRTQRAVSLEVDITEGAQGGAWISRAHSLHDATRRRTHHRN